MLWIKIKALFPGVLNRCGKKISTARFRALADISFAPANVRF
jgi:hypothetical protein